MTPDVISDEELFNKSIEAWGVPAQVAMVAEESCELAHASLRLIRSMGKAEYLRALKAFAEEIADTELMIDEMKYYFGLSSQVADFRLLKKQRLEGKLR